MIRSWWRRRCVRSALTQLHRVAGDLYIYRDAHPEREDEINDVLDTHIHPTLLWLIDLEEELE